MERPWIRVLLFTAYASFDIGVALYHSYILGLDTNVRYEHFLDPVNELNSELLLVLSDTSNFIIN
jgi:hypothetical protein